MNYRYEITKAELEVAKENHSWLADYYQILKGATVSKMMLGIYEDDPKTAIPIFEFVSKTGELYTCELLCASDLEMPGILTGLPFNK